MDNTTTFPIPSRANAVAIAALYLCGALLALFVIPPPETTPRQVSGYATVIDGDSLRVAGRDIRLHGIDAPEFRQTCRDKTGQPWPCGEAATAQLRILIRAGDWSNSHASCETLLRDKYQRLIARCRNSDGLDLSAAMVAKGYAIAYRRYSEAYVSEEFGARAAQLGLWSSSFEEPEAWRRSNPSGK